MAVINVRMLLTLLAPFVLTLQMHTDVGDRATVGDAALRGTGITDVGQGPVQQSLGTLFCQILSLSIARSSVCAASVFAYNITVHKEVYK